MHTELSLLIRVGNFWWVYSEVGKETGGWLKAKVVTEEDKRMPPVKGWKYADGNKWPSDRTLEFSREVTPACSEIVVELQGAAKKEDPGLAGSYLPVEGQINRGRWVGSYQQHSFSFNKLSLIQLSYMCFCQILTLLMALTVCRCCSTPLAPKDI